MNGRKRHFPVDTEDLLLKVVVHLANVQDRDGAKRLLIFMNVLFLRPAMLWVDIGFRGKCATWIPILLGWTLEVVQHW